jgi:hypothetical protein
MSSNYPYVVDPTQDPTLQDPTLATLQDPTQNASQAPDMAPVDFNAVPLSGDSYIPPASGGTSSLPFSPTPTGIPIAGSSTQPQPLQPGQLFAGGPKVGQNLSDYVASTQSANMPQTTPGIQSGPPPANFGNDWSGSILKQEQNLPDWARAGVHGAQSGVGPMAGMLGGMWGGEALGIAAAPFTLGISTIAFPIIGGIIGAWVGGKIQNEAGKEFVPKQTMDALNTQTAWDQQNQSGAYAIGSLIPQALAFRPSPTAIAKAFRLAGEIKGADTIAEKIATFKAGDPAAQNQLQMMVMGPGQTLAQAGYNATNLPFAQGQAPQPNVLAIDLIGSALLSQPNKWVQAISPAYRAGIKEQTQKLQQVYIDGISSKLDNLTGGDPANQPLAQAARASLDKATNLMWAGKPQEAIAAANEADQHIAELNARNRAAKFAPEAPAEPQVAPNDAEATMRSKVMLDQRSDAETILRIIDGADRESMDAQANRVGINSKGQSDEELRSALRSWAESIHDPTRGVQSGPEPARPLGDTVPAQEAQTIQEGPPLPGENVIYNGATAKVLHSNSYDHISIQTLDGVEHQVTAAEIQRPEPHIAPAQGPVPAPADAIPPREASSPVGFSVGERVSYGDGIVDVVSTLDNGDVQIKLQNDNLAVVKPDLLTHLEEPAPVTPEEPILGEPKAEPVIPGADRPLTPQEANTRRVLAQTKANRDVPIDPDIKPIKAKDAQGNSRPMSMDNIQRLGAEGKKLLEVYQHNTAPTTGLDANWESLKQQMWDKTRTAWGGMTIDSHTGVPITDVEDKYAIGAPEKRGTVSIPIDASKEDFMKAADKAKARFAPQLKRQGYNLGIFHDAKKGKIEFDPSIVVNSRHEAEAIGVYTHQDGGAYHFATGDGHFMPHLSDALTAEPMELTHYSNSPHPTLDPHFQGTGAQSAELAKTGPHFNSEDRMISTYPKGTPPEKFFGKGTSASVEHTIKGGFKILDVTSPEWNTLKRQTLEANGGIEDRQKLDTAVHQAGYDGYKGKIGGREVVKLFGKQKVSEINGIPVEHPDEGGTLQYKRETGDTPAKKGISTVEEKGRVKVFVDGDLAGVAQQGQEADRPDHWTDTKLGSRGMSTMDKSKIVSKIAEKYIADKGQRDAATAAAKADQGMVTRHSMADPVALAKTIKAGGYKVSKTIDNPPDQGMILPNGLGISFENRYVTTHSGEFADLFGKDPGPEGQYGAGRDGSHVGAIYVSGDYASVTNLDKKAGDTLTDWVLGLMKKDASFRSTHPRYGPPLSVKIGHMVNGKYEDVTIPVSVLKDNGFDFVKAAKEYGRKDPLLYSREQTPSEIDNWPQLRKAILDRGGIGPSKDWEKDWIPGDLYRINGKPPDIVAAETTIGRADLLPWGEGDDSVMFTHLREAYANHRALGLQTHQDQLYAEHGIEQGEENGLQQKTAGIAQAPGKTGVEGEASNSSKTGTPGDLSGQEPTQATEQNAAPVTGQEPNPEATNTSPNDLLNSGQRQLGNAEPGTVQSSTVGTGTVRTNAGDEARIAGSGYLTTAPIAVRDANGRPIRNADGTIQTTTPDVTPERYASGNVEAAQRGSTFTELGPKAGTSGGSSSDAVDFPQKVIDQAPQFLTSKELEAAGPILSQIGHGVRLTPAMVQETMAFLNGEGPFDRTLLRTPDDPAFIPQTPLSAKVWESLALANKVVDLIHGHANGDPNLSSIPIKITSDAGRVLLTIKGWAGRFFYDNARAFPGSLDLSAEDAQIWTVAQAVFGDQLSVLMDARATINFHSMLKAGVFANKVTGQSFDPKIFEQFTNAGIVKGFSANGVSIENLLRASLGLPPDTQKLGDYYGGMKGEARAPVDMWRARLAFGVDNTPTTRMYDYEFGRTNFLTQLFPSTHLGPDGVTQIPFMPYHQQAAEWFGYQQHVVDSIIAIKKAAFATGDADIIKMANGLKTNLVSKDLAESFRDNYGLTIGAKPPILPFHELLVAKNGRVGQVLDSISREFLTKRYVKGALGKPSGADILDIQQKSNPRDRQYGSISKMLSWNADVRKVLADYYQKHFIDTPTAKQGTVAAAYQSFNRNVGPLALKIMEIAHAVENPREFAKNEIAARAILGIQKDIYEPPYSREAMLANKETWPELQQVSDEALARLLDKAHLPQGLASIRLFYGEPDEGIANFNGERPNQLNINGRYFNYTHIIREGMGSRLLSFLRSPGAKGLKPEARANLMKVANRYKKDGNWVYTRVINHELAHLIQDRIYGNGALGYKNGAPDEQVLPAAHALLEAMTQKYMIGLVRDGLGNELEALLNAHSTTLNEYVGGVPVKGGAEIKEGLPLWEAVNNLLEHQAHQWGIYHGTDDFSQATTESFNRGVENPENAKANARELGKIYEKALKVLDNHLAVEAETQLGGRGPNPSVDRTLLQPEETDAGKQADGSPDPAAVQSGTSGWINPSTTDQTVAKQFTLGERANNLDSALAATKARMDAPDYKPKWGDRALLQKLSDEGVALRRQIYGPAEDRTWTGVLKKQTGFAVDRVQREEGEGNAAYALRVVKTLGKYGQTLDHATEIARAARDGNVQLVHRGPGMVGFKIGNKVYEETPGDHVSNWDDRFHSAIHDVVDSVEPRLLAREPKNQPLGIIPAEQLRLAFADEGAVNPKPTPPIAQDRGVEEPPIPSMRPHDFLMSDHNPPTSKLTSGSAGNKVKAWGEHLQESLDLRDAISEKGLFDPEPVLAEREKRLAEAGGQPPVPPAGGGGGDEPPGEQPPIGSGGGSPKGSSPEEKAFAAQKAQAVHSGEILRNYISALKDSLAVTDAHHLRIAGSINDLVAEVLKTFSNKEWEKDPRTWSVDAGRQWRALGMYYERVGNDIQDRILGLELKSPGANDRIRSVLHAKGDTARAAASAGLSDEEKALANHLYHYWQVIGDTLKRAGIIKTAIENYFPLMVEKETGSTTAGAGRLSAKSQHAIAKLTDEDGHFLFDSPEELQQWSDDQKLGWTVRKDVGSIFRSQGQSVTRALVMRHTVDRLKEIEVQVGNKRGESAPAILTNQRLNEHEIASENKGQYVKSSNILGPWASALKERSKGPNIPAQDLWVHKSLAEAMGREASIGEMQGPRGMGILKSINTMNAWFKQTSFILSPYHIYSMLSNVSTHVGFTGTYGAVRAGSKLVYDVNPRRYYELMKAGGPTELAPENMSGPAKFLQGADGARNPIQKVLRFQHDAMWKTVGYNGVYGMADKLSKEYLVAYANAHPDEALTWQHQQDADKFAMDASKKALGYLDNLDMSKDWDLWGNVLFLANRWTTSQLRTMGEALGIGSLGSIGKAIPLEGHNPTATDFMQRRGITMSQRLIFGGMMRLLLVGTLISTAGSAITNGGVPSTPLQNFMKDPNHTFDIYTGRDPKTNRDTWTRMPFYLFQREMVDWTMAGLKAAQEGKPLIDKNNLGDSSLLAPFERFTSKMDPITKAGLELSTGQELSQWMAGYATSTIDADPQIQNINKSLQLMGIPDGGSIENRLIYAFRDVAPGFGFPTNLPAPVNPTSDPGAVINALGLANFNNLGWQLIGSRQDQGTAYEMGSNGQMVPKWQVAQNATNKAAIGQQILALASTLGSGTPDQEKNKLQQMEGLRQQGGFTPSQLVQILLFGAGHSTGGQGLIAQNLPPETAATAQAAPIQIGKQVLTPQQEANYQSVTFQKQAFAMAQAMSDPNWKNLDYGQRVAEMNQLKTFADKITNEQFAIALNQKTGPVINEPTAVNMIAEFGTIKNATQNTLINDPTYTQASPQDQQIMMADRITASQNAVWEKYYGTTSAMKGASDSTLMQYVVLQSGLRDEARSLVESLPSFKQSLDPMAQQQELTLSLNFADNLVNQALQGKAPKTFSSPLTQPQLVNAVRNGIILQDAAIKELHQSYIYQEAPQADQLLLDSKYVTLAHNVALEDVRGGQNPTPTNIGRFNTILNNTLAADEGYQSLVEKFFGMGGRAVLAQRETELTDLKARFRQEYNVAPADLTKYDTLINRWYEQQNPDYANFIYYRKQWEKYDPLGQAYTATVQSNFGFEQSNPIAISG